ncbi:pyruvate kinase [Desulfosporosinus sp. BICA1-9]|uniref:pyruvate kinase n=1 Tax=Desulfosporosinus sp. BICA1-9 TaxID=1531958 RepID=UPI00054B6700|nr:pyruvate kinase [Desulfosporosinus sp. BICA1-9]KJS47230.1 MAG: pyruvate kinase [Peptococcaceae bacterium BRH_c23]KJS88484.1 MAG: pyruvate kinase [Desulfosporosinus sp. BICA1-9]HBW34668.1 pyruvate kinase [Desulfosporosinus sp.]
MRRTKIVCTIGPASESREKVQALLAAGMNVARLNFSHGTHEEHGHRIKILREEAARIGKHLGILLDTKGPEVRTGKVPEGGITLENGSEFSLDTDLSLGDQQRVGITYTDLWRKINPGTHILIDDGQIDLEVTSIDHKIIRTTVRNGGILKSQKGVNAPGALIDLPAVTERDIEDIRFGISQGIDFIAASFTRRAINILDVRRVVEEMEANVHIIAKIESQEGINNLDAILEVADGLMVARGDLGVEIPVEEVPIRQKEMIRKSNLLGKPVIVATQMLDSMIRQPRPTRAEASDVANAILDGTDAIMLSGETAAGLFPVEAVQMMDKIAQRTEQICSDRQAIRQPQINVAEAISFASYTIANDLQAAAILTPTHSGLTARMISKYRPSALIVAATPFETTARQLSLQWGVQSLIVPQSAGTDEMLSVAVNTSLNKKIINAGDVVVITAGVPIGKVGSTNMIKVQIMGNILAKGTGIGRKSYSGIARKVRNPERDDFKDGDILIAETTDARFVPLIARAGALVVVEGGLTSHAAIAALQYGIPAIVGAFDAFSKVTDGQTLTVDSLSGMMYEGSISIL